MNEVLYDKSSLLIVGVLLALMVAAVEIGHRIGLHKSGNASEATKAQVSSAASSLLGILALLIGFTFSISVQRFDSCSEAVVDEANAIGTAYLRIDFLPEAVQPEMRKTMREYIHLRVNDPSLESTDIAGQLGMEKQATDSQSRLWTLTKAAVKIDANPVTTGLFSQALNDMIDSYGRHKATLDRHVPEAALFLLFGVFIITASVMGFSSGISGSRPVAVSYMVVVVIALLVFMILDIDRPRRGFIRVSQTSMTDLARSIP